MSKKIEFRCYNEKDAKKSHYLNSQKNNLQSEVEHLR